ncbi:hypothetical protein [Candidatus Rhabdochlamydia sp. T3358]|uniref:hypothetical protein n=1 Tax=Candidatus Rhabdochlamydia sp. T3358 TaxID=2099795 RepID=UPI0010BBC192|nr:hypothetical protein [Candidatus Rhabdochlamydia sp. T3358]VHO03487.1 hypothetical protein RHT_00938 [Candidatus Rhabdochlamydia sp. T3358]
MSAVIGANIRLDYAPSSEMGIESSDRCDLLIRADEELQARFVEYQNTYIRAASLDVANLQASIQEHTARGQAFGEIAGSLGASTLTAMSWWHGWTLPFASLCPPPIRFIMAAIASVGAIYAAKIAGGHVAAFVSTPPPPVNEEAWKRAVALREMTTMSLLIIETSNELSPTDSHDQQQLQEQARKIALWAKNRLSMLKEIWTTLPVLENDPFQMLDNLMKI